MGRARRLPLEQLQPYLLALSQPRPIPEGDIPAGAAPLLWSALFGNDHPVEIEIGFGKGLFLINAAPARPQANFLGIEIERKYALFTATRLAKRGLTNVKLACCDARWFLKELVAAGTVQAIHVYFPDPWWKTRHRKRRLFSADFAVQCARVLQPGGHLHLITDVAEYFTETLEMLKKVPDLEALPVPAIEEPDHAEDYLTNFERKYRQQGRPICRALYSKR
jgi:tRNA (guanine-N7-)-methyltransferase